MNRPNEEAELGRAFERLRAEDASMAPDFARMLSAAEAESAASVITPPRRRITRWAAGGAGLAAAAIGGLFLAGLRADARFEAAVASLRVPDEWSSPTDFLLEVPGWDLMRLPLLTLPKVWMGVTDAGLPSPPLEG